MEGLCLQAQASDSHYWSDDEEKVVVSAQENEDKDDANSKVLVSFRDAYGGTLAFRTLPENLIATHLAAYTSEFGKEQSMLCVFWRGVILDVDTTFADNNIKHSAVFYVVDDVISPTSVVRFSACSSMALSNRSHPFRNSSDGRKFKFLTIKSLDKRILFPRSMLGTYDEAIDAISAHFPKLKKETLSLRTNAFPECEGEYVEIPPTTWTHALPELKSVDVEIETETDVIKQYPTIQILSPAGAQFEVTVKLDLEQEWMFDVVMKRRWRTVARKSGPRYYRYQTEWCAQVGVQRDILPAIPGPRDPRPRLERQSGSGNLDDHHAVVLSRDSVTFYLNRVLRTIGLGAEARAHFISNNLSGLMAKPYVALVFVPQSVYEDQAPMEITPYPDVVTRILMLYKSVPAAHIERWSNAVKRAEESTQRWIDIIGLDARRHDETLCRVWQWASLNYLPDEC
ncbi:uncharacterized protein EV420DRAFT_1711692 [Desarmillaria tabescens]|uniref:Uncharacterized protein n=1 Tax=Armillaria tabescens TaxID=1929756 RepID=A0AA39MW53_ARMTA|nr:uncharacterized protein EV420DRAFT_1711692 [Desarmillaria tabescens]KAK0448428.1 hypothetical protein EV420DRAFT_1711692 [Desarmillaria tabescens]